MHAKRFAIAALMAAAPVLSACSDPAAYHVGEAERRAMEAPPPPVKRVADIDFCRGVAHQTVNEGFDDSSRARLYAVNYRQCMVIFGPPTLRLADLGGGGTGY
jgi:hypothetical protein